jgi:hypothetical protein
MSSSPFKKTFYFGLSIFLTPIIITLVITLFMFLNRTSKIKPVKVIKEVTFLPENVIEHDTVYVEKPKPKVVPKITIEPKIVIEPKKIDSIKSTDTVNVIN